MRCLLLAAKEVAICKRFLPQNLALSENILAGLCLATSLYGMQSKYAYIIAGNVSQSLSHAAISRCSMGPAQQSLLYWGTGLALQAALGVLTGTAGLFVASYVVGSVLQNLTTHLFDTATKKKDTTTQLSPVTLFSRKFLGHLAFGIGSYIGQSTFQSVTEQNNLCVNEERIDPEESSLLGNQKACSKEPLVCQKIALKTLDLPEDPFPQSAQIKKAYRTMSLRWHPDKVQQRGCDPALATRVAMDINNAYGVLRP